MGLLKKLMCFFGRLLSETKRNKIKLTFCNFENAIC